MSKLIDFLNHAANEHTTGKNKWDVGYTYISFEFEEKQRFPKLILNSQNKTAIRLNLVGRISPVPKVGSLLCTTVFGIQFWYEPSNSFETGQFLPGWLVPEGTLLATHVFLNKL